MRKAMVLATAVAGVVLCLGTPSRAAQLEEARIFIEFNSTDNDLGFHVFLDGEDWKRLSIVNPDGLTIFEVEGKAAYGELGLTELFFEGAEPTLDDVPLEQLLARFPEGQYQFVGETVDGESLQGTATLSHAVPAGPEVSARVRDDDKLVISWRPAEGPPEGFPDREIEIVGYQVIVESFQVTLPPSARRLRVPPEFVKSLEDGEHSFEVLAIDASGNQTISEDSFVIGDDEGDEDRRRGRGEDR